ncbi:MAG TPA: hypothetical protein VK525_04260 [Candidatus Saccharimonadales bacterium]|nr:hypothetical protein [Candidatus Saccharimonadales bacterium]
MINRRDLLKSAALLAGLGPVANSPAQDDQPGSPFPAPQKRLDQGPFGIEQDEGWRTILYTSPSEEPVGNPGLGLVGYIWEENGPSIAARQGRETIEQHVENMASLPFVDVLYIRCDWKHVQSEPGRLNLAPFWQLTFDAAKRHNLRVAFRVQLSNPESQPAELALPKFLAERVPLVKIGKIPKHPEAQYLEPRYDHPEFQKAFTELNELLAARFDGDPLLEWVDMMQYGFWGEGHTSNFPNPFPDRVTAENTFVKMTQLQIAAWKKTPLATNTQPDISNVGNRAVIDMSKKAGCWLRSDSIIVEEPIQIDELAGRPPWLAAILEDGGMRQYDIAKIAVDSVGVNRMENFMLHVLDIRANYWGLWTESANLRAFNQKYPRGFARLRASLGYRLRPAWVWQRKRNGTFELVIGIANRGVAGVPGVLWITAQSADKKWTQSGTLDAGHPHGGGLRLCSFLLPTGFREKVLLSAELELRPGVKKPVRWSCEQATNRDGSITVELRGEGDPGWRKGV